MLGYIASFVSGVIVGVGSKFLADWLTDWRHRIETTKAERKQFDQVCRKMPELIREMREDLAKCPAVSRFTVLKHERIGFRESEPTFRYYSDTHAGISGMLATLEELGYIQDISPGDAPIYRIKESLVNLLLNE